MLGIDWIKILIHFAVFVVLAVGLYLLLYKPVLRFIRTRQENIQKDIDQGNALKEEGEAQKAAYDGKIAAIEEERDRILAEAESRKQEILDEARARAKEESDALIADAKRRAEAAEEAATAQLQQDAGKIAVDIAGEILQREISQEENEKIILDCLKAWSDHD